MSLQDRTHARNKNTKRARTPDTKAHTKAHTRARPRHGLQRTHSQSPLTPRSCSARRSHGGSDAHSSRARCRSSNQGQILNLRLVSVIDSNGLGTYRRPATPVRVPPSLAYVPWAVRRRLHPGDHRGLDRAAVRGVPRLPPVHGQDRGGGHPAHQGAAARHPGGARAGDAGHAAHHLDVLHRHTNNSTYVCVDHAEQACVRSCPPPPARPASEFTFSFFQSTHISVTCLLSYTHTTPASCCHIVTTPFTHLERLLCWSTATLVPCTWDQRHAMPCHAMRPM